MSTPPSQSTQPVVAASKPVDLGEEIRRTAQRAARQSQAEDARQGAAAAVEQGLQEESAKLARKKRFLGPLLGAFVLLSALNMAGLGMQRSAKPAPWTEQSLDLYLRDELTFEAESIDLFVQEHGRVPHDLQEMGYPPDGDLAYEALGQDTYRLTITDSDKSLTYESRAAVVSSLGE